MAVGAGGALRWVDTQWPGAPASRRRAQARARAAAHGLCSRRRLLRRPGRALRVRGGPRGQGRQVGAAAHAAARGVHQLLPGAREAGPHSEELAPEGGPADAARPCRCAATATRRRATPSCPSAARTCRRAPPRARARLAKPAGAGRSPARRGAQGATNVLLEGVYHSVSRAAAGDRPSARPWYGSAAVVDAWARFLL